MIEVVLWFCDRVGPDVAPARLGELCALGLDVVLVAAEHSGPGAGPGAVPAGVSARTSGPGRIFVWSGQPPEVVEVAPVGSAGAPSSAPVPVSVGGTTPGDWARRCLVGAGAPDAMLTVTDPAQLDELLRSHAGFPVMVDARAWRLEAGGFEPRREGDVEAWLTVGNGRTGTRGSLEEGTAQSSPRVYVAGVFGCVPGDPDGPELAPGPEWTHLQPRVDGETVDMGMGETIEHRRILDLRQATTFREWRQRLPTGREWTFRSARLASLADREILAMQAEAEAEAGAGAGPGTSANPATVTLAGEVPLPATGGTIASATADQADGRLVVSMQACGGAATAFAVSDDAEGGRVDRLVAVGRTIEAGDDQSPGDAAVAALARARKAGMAAVQARHRRAWRDRWREADVVVEADADAQEALRFSLYHLISAGDPGSDVASVGARALTGPGYRGHVFWDTEVFVLPFFIWTHPPTARALLAYRYRTLAAARSKAVRLGYQGALYPWESADTGDEVTPASIDLPDGTTLSILTGLQEHHISADVAWATWQYWQATADDEFLVTMGAEMIVETARFWASRTRMGDDGRHHIDEVIGPDEYHEGVDDNAYTNILARWNLRAAVEVCALVPSLDPAAWDELAQRLDVQPAEMQRWESVATGLVDGFDPDSRLYEQFAGFFALENLRSIDLAPRPFTGEMVVGVDRLRHTQIVKQADVVMLAHMLPEVLPAGAAAANYGYYEPRTCHGSSLSPAIHAAVAARVGALDEAMDYFRAAARLDLADHMGNAAKGVHIATMGGLWQAAVFGFGGVRPERDFVRIDPHLPPAWEKLSFPLRWRGVLIDVEVTATTLVLHLDGSATVAVGTGDHSRLAAGSFVAHRDGDGWSAAVDAVKL
ncbi:MAG: glycoside hydrolase family 65 [Actinomycetota bacterium]|nr:glycoside hydrolase family 65 [Actinomycetota bacterium]